MHKPFLHVAILSAALSVMLGAFSAHALKKIISPEALTVFETGVKYQFYHSFAILAAGILFQSFANKYVLWAGRCFLTGIILFSGSLYALAILMPQFRFLGMITPLGGISFIAGWLFLFKGISAKK
jgi:uncharacterized membrane protein YgdD (TMEM256/DUF423 family)